MSSRTSVCTPATILSCSIMRSTTRRCVYSRGKQKRKKKKLGNSSLPCLTLIVNVEDRRQRRNNYYVVEKQRRRRRRKCNRFPVSERTGKISSNASNRMVVVMVSSIACVGYLGDQLQCV